MQGLEGVLSRRAPRQLHREPAVGLLGCCAPLQRGARPPHPQEKCGRKTPVRPGGCARRPHHVRRCHRACGGWLLDQAAIFAAFKKPGAPGRVRASKTSRMGSVCTPKADGRAVRTSARPAEPKGTRAGGWRRTPTTAEAGTHPPQREWSAPAPRASPWPFRRRLRLKGDGPVRSWRRQTPGGLFVEQFVEQGMLNLDAT